jgi:HYR domain
MRRGLFVLWCALVLALPVSALARRGSNPRISGVRPAPVARTGPQQLRVSGWGFKAGLRPSTGSASSVTNTAFTWTVTFPSPGTSQLSVSNPDGETSDPFPIVVAASTEVQTVGPPTLACPAPVQWTTPDGASDTVRYPAPVVSGGAQPVSTTCVPASGSLFPVGQTTVSCTATDALNRTATCSFPVTVLAPTSENSPVPPPTISCPFNQTASSPNGGAVSASYPAPNVTGGVAPVSTSCSPASGSTFSVGTTPVACSATDSLKRTAACQFTMTVLGSTNQAPTLSQYRISGTAPLVGATSPYAGNATFSDGSSRTVDPSQATWNSSNFGIARWVAPGQLQGVAAGTTTITSVYGGMTASQSVTVTAASTTTPPAPTPVSSGKALLSQNDLTFLGGFQIPSPGPSGGATEWGKGFTIRNGKLLSIAGDHTLDEWNIPTTLGQTAATFPNATPVRGWGNVFRVRWTTQYGSDSGFVHGMYWDPIDQRLYWDYGDTYKANLNPDPSMGYTTLNDANGSFVSVDSWQVGDNSKMTMGGVLAIPDWWSTQHTPGKRLAAGFGGYESIVATGPASMGLSLFAFNPADLATTPSHGKINSTTMVMYPYNQGCTGRMQRDTNYTTEFDNCNPVNGVGFNTWVDITWQSAVWIDTPTKTGILVVHVEGNGRVWYQTSTGHAERGSHWMRVYHPDDLADVAHGVKQPWDIQPRLSWPVQFPAQFTYPLPGWQDEPTYMVTGVVYDPTTQKLYVAVRFAIGPGVNQLTSSNRTAIYVFQVS